jgi:hypothetical protein
MLGVSASYLHDLETENEIVLEVLLHFYTILKQKIVLGVGFIFT